ncbi:a1-alpha2 repression [Entomortierella beljakovae]|nr:a1-alpha2 repression [Entomortierella beljakovae]
MIDNDTLKKLFKAGAILLVLDAPHNQLEFGIDVNCWNTGPRFKGIKIIPPGPHFVYYSLHNTKSAKSSSNDSAKEDGTLEVTEGGTTGGDVRVGFWHMFESGEVVVMKWNAYNEEMELEKDIEQVSRYKAGIQEFDPFLGSYPLLPPESTYPAWVKLSNHIKNTTIKSIFKDGFVSSYDELLEEELARASKLIDRQQKQETEETAAKETKKIDQGNPMIRTTNTIIEEDEAEAEQSELEMEIEPITRADVTRQENDSTQKTPANVDHVSAVFTPIDLRSSFRKGAVGEEVTRYSLDKSWLLNHVFTTVHKSDDMTANFLEQALKVLGRNTQSRIRRGECLELRKPMHGLQRAVLDSFEWKLPGDFKKVQTVTESFYEDEDEEYIEEGEYAPVIVE